MMAGVAVLLLCFAFPFLFYAVFKWGAAAITIMLGDKSLLREFGDLCEKPRAPVWEPFDWQKHWKEQDAKRPPTNGPRKPIF